MPSLGVGVEGLDCLGEDVRSRVPQDSQPVLAVDGHRLDDAAVSDDVVEVAELPVDAGDDDAADVTCSVEELAGRRLRVGRSLAPGDGDADLCRHGGHRETWSGKPLSAVALKGYRLHGAGCEAAGQVLAPHPLHVAAGPGSAAYEIACPPMATLVGMLRPVSMGFGPTGPPPRRSPKKEPGGT